MPPMSRRELLERGLHVAVLWALAVAQPLFDLLGRNPEFFATRGSPPGDIVAFALLVTFAVPLAVLALEWLAGLIGEAVAWAVHLVCVAVLVGAIALQAISLAGTGAGLAVALGLGAAAASRLHAPAGRAHVPDRARPRAYRLPGAVPGRLGRLRPGLRAPPTSRRRTCAPPPRSCW